MVDFISVVVDRIPNKDHRKAMPTKLKNVSRNTLRLLIVTRHVYAVQRVLLSQQRRARAIVR